MQKMEVQKRANWRQGASHFGIVANQSVSGPNLAQVEAVANSGLRPSLETKKSEHSAVAGAAYASAATTTRETNL
jgi:hypothetical protein